MLLSELNYFVFFCPLILTGIRMWHKFSTQAVAQRAGKSVQRNAPLITKQPRIIDICASIGIRILGLASRPLTLNPRPVVAAELLVWNFGTRLNFDVGGRRLIGIAVRYGLGGPGIESRCGRDFPYPS